MAITAPRAAGAHEHAPLLKPSASSGGITGDAFDYEALTLAEQSAGIGVWSIDLTTSTVRGTAQFFRIMGLPPTSDPVPVDMVRALRHPEDRERVVSGFRQALDGHADTYEIEYRIIRPDGSLRWIFGRGRVMRDAAGKPVRYSGIDLDITDRKNAEAALAAAKEELERMNQALEQRVLERTAQLRAEAERRVEAEARLHQAQKMEAVGQLTGGVAHDFNNILQVIVGNLEIARIALATIPNGGDAKAMVLRAIETMQRASQSAKQLVHRLLAFSRRQVLEPAAIDVNALIADMSDMIARTLGETIRVETHLAPTLWPTFVDRSQLESALLNLVVNARDAMPNGGELVIETANTAVPRRHDDGDDIAPGSYVTLAVKDSGCGIPSDHLDKVLEPFFTTKDTGKGSGLGLSMIYGFVTQSGGHLRIDSVIGRGTTVRLYLPRLDPARAAAVTGASSVNGVDAIPRANPGETILLVEDNEDVRRLGVAALESLGYRVLHAVNGAAALELLSSPEGASVDLLFTDMILPGGMNGRALAQAVTSQRPGLPVLFASGYSPAVAGHAGPDDSLLDKPYSTDSLALRCRQALDRQRSSNGSRPA